MMPAEEQMESLRAEFARPQEAKRRRPPTSGRSKTSIWFKDHMRELGFTWIPCMKIGAGCDLQHIRQQETTLRCQRLAALGMTRNARHLQRRNKVTTLTIVFCLITSTSPQCWTHQASFENPDACQQAALGIVQSRQAASPPMWLHSWKCVG
jgi:hypothetical protein